MTDINHQTPHTALCQLQCNLVALVNALRSSCRFGSLRRTGSDVDDGEGPLMEGLNARDGGPADSDMEMAAGTPTTPVAALQLGQQRGSTLSPRSSSALNNTNKFNTYV